MPSRNLRASPPPRRHAASHALSSPSSVSRDQSRSCSAICPAASMTNERSPPFWIPWTRPWLACPWRMLAELNRTPRSEEHTSELQSLRHLVCRLLLGSEEH